MKNKYLITALLVAISAFAKAQSGFGGSTPMYSAASPQPFLFSVNTLTASTPFWSVNYSGSYGERVAGPFGFDGVDQQLAVKGYMGNRFTLYGNAAIGFGRSGGVTSAQQIEVLRDVLGGKQLFGPRLGISLGAGRDWSNVKSVFSRVTASFDKASWRVIGNARFEKAFSSKRDDIDLISSVGFQHRLTGNFYAGIEAVGEDLEGFWEADEAEGGAKLLVGPSLNLIPSNSRLAFSLCGGPVFYATHSNVIPSEAIRDVGTIGAQNGFTVRASVSFNLHQ